MKALKNNSMEFKGTKGKWYVSFIDDHNTSNNNCGCHSVTTNREKKIGMIDIWFSDSHIIKSKEEALANALLISKAPEMLEMLIGFVERWDFVNPHLFHNAEIEQARQLIKEATEL